MTVSAPAAGSQVHFHIAAARGIFAYLNHGVAKIRTALKIVESRVKHADRLTIQGLELIAPQSLVKPNGLKQPLGRGIEILAQQRRRATTDAPLGVKAGFGGYHSDTFSGISHKKFTGQLTDESFHFQAEERD